MRKIIRGYYYFFYIFYKISEAAPARFWSDWKAGITIVILEILIISSMTNYYVLFIDRSLELSEINNYTLAICILIVIIPNYFVFIQNEAWKDYVKNFEGLPKVKNRIGKWIVYGIVLLVIVNFIFSFYLYYQI